MRSNPRFSGKRARCATHPATSLPVQTPCVLIKRNLSSKKVLLRSLHRRHFAIQAAIEISLSYLLMDIADPHQFLSEKPLGTQAR
jgi:hypothetical protein